MLGDDPLGDALELSRRAGFLGPAPVADHLRHSRAFMSLIGAGARLADLGAGGGVPGLVVAAERPDLEVVLIESSRRRADHLRRLIERLSLAGRVSVDDRPAETVGRDPARRGAFDIVVARGFAPPAATAECAAPLLGVGGRLLVAEPPAPSSTRWAGLATTDLPLTLVQVRAADGAHIAELVLQARCPDRYPRRPGVPARSPRF